MKRVTLNKDSWHFKYYSAVMSETPPSSLCPYFWQMVVLLLLSPFIVLVSGIIWSRKKVGEIKTFDKPKKEKPYEEMLRDLEKRHQKMVARHNRMNAAVDVIAKLSKYIFLPLIIILMIYGFYLSATKIGLLMLLLQIGIGILAVSILVGFVWAGVEYGDRIARPIGKFFRVINPLNWKFVQIIGEMIYAWYKNACPLITWEGDAKKVNEDVKDF